jgi:ABC-type multidrug transport system ATPase subunit
MSTDEEENPTFYQFTHVIIPYCSSDLWLGQGNNSRFRKQGFQFHNDSSVNDFIFRGYTIFHSVIEDLLLDGLMIARQVVMVGSSAGGIGVLNHIGYVQSMLPTATVAAILDSSWFINFDANLAARFVKETAILSQYHLLPWCQTSTQSYPCCISVKCMLQSHLPLPHIPLFIISSVYDIYILSQSIRKLSENKASLFDYTRAVFQYGGAMTESVEDVLNMNWVTLFMASCTQHVYLVTSSLWDPGQLFNHSIIHDYSRGTAYFQHAIRPGNWRKVSIDGTTLQAAISSWYNSNYTKNHKLIDNCNTVICNPTCPDQVTFSVVDVDWPSAIKVVVVATAISLCLICVAVKVIMMSCQIWLDGYLCQIKTNEESIKTCLYLPDCTTEEQMNMACMNLSYSLPPIKRFRACQLRHKGTSLSTSRNHIIKGVSAYFNPGELVAVMGPSGCGKTTFLDTLMGRRKGPIKGEILINGIPKHARTNFADYTGYVPQLATPYYEDLTVCENLLYLSILQLSENTSWHNRIKRVLQVMGETGLLHYANTKVGGLTKVGLSGGQKRRLCVALQLLRLPRILLLDEPTSGLDASASLDLLKTLHCLALSGRTVILTIHQPRLEIYHMFHKILFLCRGQVYINI